MSRSRPISRKRRRRRSYFARLWPSARWRRRTWRAFWSAPLPFRVITGAVALGMVWAVTNGVYQVVRKPTELFFPVSGGLNKMPTETWRTYEAIFRAHATAVITPDLLAALAQNEGAGNPVARTYWRWQATWDPFAVYRPASSAVGMYQITDGTYAEAKRYCIHNHVVVEDGPWHALRSCWFNWLYLRVVPTHATEMTAALLDRRVAHIVEGRRITTATLVQKQQLAAIIHLCGAGIGEAYARRGFRLTPNQRCGDHDISDYLARFQAMQRFFARLAGGAKKG